MLIMLAAANPAPPPPPVGPTPPEMRHLMTAVVSPNGWAHYVQPVYKGIAQGWLDTNQVV